MVQLGRHTNAQIDELIVRHMILNSIRMYKTKFQKEYGEFVVACDATNYWRKTMFPYYKANRKKSQAASELDWKVIFECLNKIREELTTRFPFRVVRVDTAEADDIIATLCHTFAKEQDILILSGDKDFQQLQKYPRIKQYNPVMKSYVSCANPDVFLKEHIIRGDSGDGIPNFLSDDNSLVIGTRQKSITQKKLMTLLAQEPEQFCETNTQLRNYKRNQALIDLSCIPPDVSASILEQYNMQTNKTTPDLMSYFIQNKLKNLMEHLHDFM